MWKPCTSCTCTLCLSFIFHHELDQYLFLFYICLRPAKLKAQGSHSVAFSGLEFGLSGPGHHHQTLNAWLSDWHWKTGTQMNSFKCSITFTSRATHHMNNIEPQGRRCFPHPPSLILSSRHRQTTTAPDSSAKLFCEVIYTTNTQIWNVNILPLLEMPKATPNFREYVLLFICTFTLYVSDKASHCFVDTVCRGFGVIFAQYTFSCLTDTLEVETDSFS